MAEHLRRGRYTNFSDTTGGTGTGRVQLFVREGFDWELVDDMDVAHVGCEYGAYDATKPYGQHA